MKEFILTFVLGLGLVPLHASAAGATAEQFGTPVRVQTETRVEAIEPYQVNRTVVIGPSTKWVNVTQGEIIRFVIPESTGAKDFVWHFDGARALNFDLREIAPSGMLSDRNITVYVAQDPAMEGG